MRIKTLPLVTLKTLLIGSLSLPLLAQGATEFTAGPVIESFGAVTDVAQTAPLTGKEQFKVVFDAVEQSKGEKPNRKFESLARFLNMHARAGVKPEQIQLAVVVHGNAGFDVLKDSEYRGRFQRDNPNTALLAALMEHNVRVILCGQSAAYHGIEAADLLPGVEVALSAMTAHALLQEQGYTLNPF